MRLLVNTEIFDTLLANCRNGPFLVHGLSYSGKNFLQFKKSCRSTVMEYVSSDNIEIEIVADSYKKNDLYANVTFKQGRLSHTKKGFEFQYKVPTDNFSGATLNDFFNDVVAWNVEFIVPEEGVVYLTSNIDTSIRAVIEDTTSKNVAVALSDLTINRLKPPTKPIGLFDVLVNEGVDKAISVLTHNYTYDNDVETIGTMIWLAASSPEREFMAENTITQLDYGVFVCYPNKESMKYGFSNVFRDAWAFQKGISAIGMYMAVLSTSYIITSADTHTNVFVGYNPTMYPGFALVFCYYHPTSSPGEFVTKQLFTDHSVPAIFRISLGCIPQVFGRTDLVPKESYDDLRTLYAGYLKCIRILLAECIVNELNGGCVSGDTINSQSADDVLAVWKPDLDLGNDRTALATGYSIRLSARNYAAWNQSKSKLGTLSVAVEKGNGKTTHAKSLNYMSYTPGVPDSNSEGGSTPSQPVQPSKDMPWYDKVFHGMKTWIWLVISGVVLVIIIVIIIIGVSVSASRRKKFERELMHRKSSEQRLRGNPYGQRGESY
jgi:hypothetical protein